MMKTQFLFLTRMAERFSIQALRSLDTQEFSIDIFIFQVYRAPTVAESYPASVDVLH